MPRPRSFGNTETPNSALVGWRVSLPQVGQVGHGHQFQAAIEDTVDLVAIEVELVHIAADVAVTGGIAEAKVAVGFVQGLKVRQDPRPVPWRERSDRAPSEGCRRWGRYGRSGNVMRAPCPLISDAWYPR
jgi:hypothetical protein